MAPTDLRSLYAPDSRDRRSVIGHRGGSIIQVSVVHDSPGRFGVHYALQFEAGLVAA